jgi:hypothetical protein
MSLFYFSFSQLRQNADVGAKKGTNEEKGLEKVM